MAPEIDVFRARQLKAFQTFFVTHAPLKLTGVGTGIPEAWFLGPKAENEDILLELVQEAIRRHTDFRRAFHPEDPTYITDEVKHSPAYRDAIASLRAHAATLFDHLQKSAPLFSMRYQSHMLWDQALPAMVGYFGAMLYNQNNVAAEASPYTTQMEIEVGNDLCRMLGFSVPDPEVAKGTIVPWGHITCDGTVANVEGLWVARNAKFFAIALREALRTEPSLSVAKGLQVTLLDGTKDTLVNINDNWKLLNLKIDDVVSLPQTLSAQYGIDPAVTTAALASYAVQNIGLVDFYVRFLPGVPSPVLMAPATRHYSWPKAATLLGLGQNNIRRIFVDMQARMAVDSLRNELEQCLADKRPVLAVVAVIGSTEESAVDPLRDIVSLRDQFRRRGLDFAVHCDAAWGGYFNSIRRPAQPPAAPPSAANLAETGSQGPRLSFLRSFEKLLAEVPALPMSPYVDQQYAALPEADSITVDPHKAGYIPYPAGSICYRNSAMRDLISLKAPVIFHSASEPTVGIYGVEGSKPGAAAAAVWLAHKVIPPTAAGYGKILGQCMWTSKRMYCRLVTLRERDPDKDPRYKITLFQMLPAEREGKSAAEIAQQKKYIAEHFVDCSNQELLDLLARDVAARDLFRELGSDQVILDYTFNFRDKAGRWNDDPGRLAQLNSTIFELCSITDPKDDVNAKLLILTSSEFDVASYGADFVGRFGDRLGIKNPAGASIPFLISTTMDPWTTDTPAGDFLAVVEQALRTVFHQALDKLGF